MITPYFCGFDRGGFFYHQKGGSIMIDSDFHIKINDVEYGVNSDAMIIEVINDYQIEHPQVCYLPEVDPIETCDTCIVEADGELVRACSTRVTPGMDIQLNSSRAKASQTEAM